MGSGDRDETGAASHGNLGDVTFQVEASAGAKALAGKKPRESVQARMSENS